MIIYQWGLLKLHPPCISEFSLMPRPSQPERLLWRSRRGEDISPTVLNSRLSELREAGIIELREGEGYIITEEGIALGKIINQLNTWAKCHAERTASGEAYPLHKALKRDPDSKNKKTS